jgi:hypothetical protein
MQHQVLGNTAFLTLQHFFCYYFRSITSPFPPGLRFVTFFQHLMTSTEQVDVAVTLHTCIREMLGSTLAGAPAILTKVSRGFP